LIVSMTADLVAPHDGVMADDPAARPRRRRFSPEYKLAILAEYDRLTEPGDKGALLRREGLYTSHIVEWRRARDAGALSGLADLDLDQDVCRHHRYRPPCSCRPLRLKRLVPNGMVACGGRVRRSPCGRMESTGGSLGEGWQECRDLNPPAYPFESTSLRVQ
jgi:hypothetical protein